MLNEDYKDILSALSEEKVEFIIVGAYALGVHGLPRATGDIDIFVRPGRDNSIRLYNALIRFGAPMDEISRDDFQEEDVVFQIGIVPRRIDIITSIDGVTFDEAYSDRITTTVDGLMLPVISVEKLIKNKVAAGRDKDLLDVKILKGHSGKS